MTQAPEVEVDLTLNDDPADFASENVDISFQNSRSEDSQIVAELLLPVQMLFCASPECARKNGLPRSVEELPSHHCINFRFASGRIHEWEFILDGQLRKETPKAGLRFNDADLVLTAVLDGQGIAQMASCQICDLLREGGLVACLAQYAPDDRDHYLSYLRQQRLPSHIRVFIDHMTAAIRALDFRCVNDPLAAQ